MSLQTEIERFIRDEILMGGRPELAAEEPLVSSGLLDSLGILRLITFLEERFGIQVGDGDVGEENFGSLARLSTFVERKLRERSGSDAATAS